MSGRRVAGAVVLAVLGAGVGFVVHGAFGRQGAVPAPPPYPLPAAASTALGPIIATAAVPGQEPMVVIYATSSCPHCRAELRRWSALVDRDAALLEGVNVVVVSPEPATAADGDWLPPSLAARRIHDADGSLARALAIRAVPTVFFVGPDRVVRDVAVGQQSESVTLRRLHGLAARPLVR
jgi:peroxiredoxin